MGRGLVIALILSVTINVFAAGVFSGRLLHGGRPAAGPPLELRGEANPLGFMRDAQILPPEAREQFRSKIRTHMPDMRKHALEMRQLRRALGEALTAEDWDRDTVEKALLEMQTAQARQREVVSAAFIDALESLSPEERALLIEHSKNKRDERRRRFRDRSMRQPSQEE